MKNNKKAMIGILVIIVLVVIGIVIWLLSPSKAPENEKEVSQEKQEEVLDFITSGNGEKELQKYSEEDLSNVMTSIGSSSQFEDEMTTNPKVKEYTTQYKKEYETLQEKYMENTNYEVSNKYYDETQKKYFQEIRLDSYSIMGYSIVYNDLLYFLMDKLANAYENQNVSAAAAEDWALVDAKIRSIALTLTNQHFESYFDERYTITVTLEWEYKNGEWICNNLATVINSLADPEGISTTDGTEGYDKWHIIASGIMDAYESGSTFHVNNPLSINNIK